MPPRAWSSETPSWLVSALINGFFIAEVRLSGVNGVWACTRRGKVPRTVRRGRRFMAELPCTVTEGEQYPAPQQRLLSAWGRPGGPRLGLAPSHKCRYDGRLNLRTKNAALLQVRAG